MIIDSPLFCVCFDFHAPGNRTNGSRLGIIVVFLSTFTCRFCPVRPDSREIVYTRQSATCAGPQCHRTPGPINARHSHNDGSSCYTSPINVTHVIMTGHCITYHQSKQHTSPMNAIHVIMTDHRVTHHQSM